MKFKDIYGDLSGTIYNGSFNCANNKLTSLEGAPREVGGSFYCYNNNLTSLEGLPFQEVNRTDFSDIAFKEYAKARYPHYLI